MEKYKNLYITEVLILLIYIVLKLLCINQPFFLQYFDAIYFCLIFIYFYFKYGIARDKNYYTKISVRYIIIFLLLYVLIIYGLVLFMGFTKTIYDNSLVGILKNALPITILVIFRELTRFIVAYNSKKNMKPIILLTIIYILFDCFSGFVSSSFNSFYNIFQLVCLTILPSISKHMLLSYLTYKINCFPSLVYSLPMEVLIYVLPFFPNLGDYLTAVISLFLPFCIYLFIKKLLSYDEKEVLKIHGLFIKIFMIITITFLIIIIILVSGIFKYKMIAIASDSMNPIYYRGDAIIYEKVSLDELQKNDILVFEYNNSVVTHRIINIIEENGQKYFQTKGDNNSKADLNLVSMNDVLGKVKYIVKYIGFPTVWFNETF